MSLGQTCMDEGVNIHWWEECLHPDDFDGHKKVKKTYLNSSN
jgi:L-rhamnonate dehydratase